MTGSLTPLARLSLVCASLWLLAASGEEWTLGPFVRHREPVLVPDPTSTFRCPVRNADVRWEAGGVLNPAATVRAGRVHLLYRAEDSGGEAGGISRIGLAVSDVATSKTRASFKPVLSARRGRFDSVLVEPGPPAILRPEGILLLYNASNSRARGDPMLPDGAYAAGQALLDPADPTALLARVRNSFLRPESASETGGQIPDVCFVQSLVFFKGRWLLYYGMGDSRIGVAEYRPDAMDSA